MRRIIAGVLAALLFAVASSSSFAGESGTPLTLVVMDPLAAPLACDCVQGYAQRKYEKLAEYLQAKLGRTVQVVFAESLHKALKEEKAPSIDIVVGKHSVILADLKSLKRSGTPIASLTGMDGSTTMRGLFVVRKEDPAQNLSDLRGKGYRVLLGPAENDEKYAAPLAVLKSQEIAIPQQEEICKSCGDAASRLLELPKTTRAVAAISSYAEPLLEGCGSIKKGDIRVIGKTPPMPFVSAFTTDSVPVEQQKVIQKALLEINLNAPLLIALETRDGFVKFRKPKPPTKATTGEASAGGAKKKRLKNP